MKRRKVRKSLPTYRLAYLFRNAANLRKQIFKKGDIARGNSSLYYASHNPQEELRSPRILEFCSINMSEKRGKIGPSYLLSENGDL